MTAVEWLGLIASALATLGYIIERGKRASLEHEFQLREREHAAIEKNLFEQLSLGDPLVRTVQATACAGIANYVIRCQRCGETFLSQEIFESDVHACWGKHD